MANVIHILAMPLQKGEMMNIEIILQIVTSIAALFGLGMIWFQLRLSTKLSQYEALTSAHQEISSNEFRIALRQIYQTEHLDESCSDEIKEAFGLVSGCYDLMGARLQDGVLPYDGTLKTEWKELMVLWPKVEPLVLARQKGRDTPYKEHFEWLFEQANLYRQKHYPSWNPHPNLAEISNNKTNTETELKGNILYKGDNLQFWRHKSGWEYIHRIRGRGGVTILPLTAKQEIIFVEQYRVPLKSMVVELPAGLIGDSTEFTAETVYDAVKRELFEETGYECQVVKELAMGPLLPGLTDEINVLCLAEGLSKQGDRLSEKPTSGCSETAIEISKVHVIPVSRVLGWLDEQRKADKKVDLRTYAALFFLQESLQTMLQKYGK
jgi:ADP-ribose pyrophosphatase